MAAHRPHLSVTLPRGFQFHYTDTPEPQTPLPSIELAQDISEPPPPPKQTFKLRRRRAEQPDHVQQAMAFGSALPTFEMTEAEEDSRAYPDADLTPGYLAPRPSYFRMMSPPKTPASQVTTYSTDSTDTNEWSMINSSRGHFMERPMSACSSFSDSSASSFGGSDDSHPSFGGGSCTSPESDAADPFSHYELKSGAPQASPLSTDLPTAKRARTTRHPKWTAEMDNHLWLTYMVYVQDPRVTPFKMLPGTAPPLGVCHRVAREAKRTWKGHRTSQGDLLIPRISVQRADSPDTICPSGRGDSSTPTAIDYQRLLPSKWPRSEAATRRRLRDLCKRKPSLSAHYLRLLRTRSPSPFESSSSSSPKTHAATQPSAFSSRSMNVSLTAATAPSMQVDGPLAQLSKETPETTPAPPVQRPADWFARAGRFQARAQARAQAHQKSQSLQLGLGLGSGTWSGPGSSFERGTILASPFDSDTGRDHFLPGMNATQSLGRAYLNRQDNVAALKSPLELHAPMPTARSLKRRFGVEPDTPASSQSLQDIFAAPSSSSRMPRNRGFSLSAVGGHSAGFAGMFTPQSTQQDHPMTEALDPSPISQLLGPPRPLEPPRLGSPFGGNSSNNRFNTFPRRFTPQEADLQEQPFEERRRLLSASSTFDA